MARSNPLLPPLTGRPSAFMANSPLEEAHLFHQHPTIAVAARVTLQSAGVGLLVSAVQNALDKCVLPCSLRPCRLHVVELVGELADPRRNHELTLVAGTTEERWAL